MTERRILPTETIRPVRRTRIAATFVLMASVVIALDVAAVAVLRANPELGNPTFLGFELQWQRLLDPPHPTDTLVLGDSSGNHGVDPYVVDEIVGSNSLNACTNGDAAVLNVLWQVEAYLQRFPPPERVLLVNVHDLWWREFRPALLASVPLPWGFWRASAAPVEFEPRERLDAFLVRFVPIYALNETVGRWIERPWDPARLRLHHGPRGLATISSGDPEFVRQDAANHLEYGVPNGWRISDQSRRALEALVDLAGRHDFELHLVDSPLLDELVEDPAFGTYLATQRETLGAIAATSDNVHVLFERPRTYDATSMQNSDHILRSAIEDYSRAVAEGVLAVE